MTYCPTASRIRAVLYCVLCIAQPPPGVPTTHHLASPHTPRAPPCRNLLQSPGIVGHQNIIRFDGKRGPRPPRCSSCDSNSAGSAPLDRDHYPNEAVVLLQKPDEPPGPSAPPVPKGPKAQRPKRPKGFCHIEWSSNLTRLVPLTTQHTYVYVL
ncbi:hypothetical protein N8I77_003800 [Diaporthe amygdali]|uniref:Uncharacterized protein n=1 Tax=Phomopsis amygdali TaxID=1214568 RepID=A0AAD9W765_PHOAM|nr:hypothetical protein N8I77_003800 [Diaporthe amygdali]